MIRELVHDPLLLGVKSFTGFTAQIIQHEVDHCKGVLI